MKPAGSYNVHNGCNRDISRSLKSSSSTCSSNCESTNSDKSSVKTINTEASENVHVVVRCRSRTQKEKALQSPIIIQLPDKNQLENHVTVRTSLDPSVSTQLASARTYTVDRVFGPELTQENVFEEIGKPLCEDFIKGYNCTVFAYGQTGAGKTYTMTGSMDGGLDGSGDLPEGFGLIPRFISQIFALFKDDPHLAKEAVLKCSFVEIYNEQLRDLLSSTKHSQCRVRIYQKKLSEGNQSRQSKEIAVDGLETFQIRSVKEGLNLLKQGIRKRSTAATDMNKRSSRSHALFTITLIIKDTEPGSEVRYRVSKLNLVDLAGSENISRSGSKNARAKEAGSINQSLLTLGRVITALSDGNRYIPYRESKLTRLLQDSLGGQTKTVLVANISPVEQDLQSTVSTMEYASKAKNIRNTVQIGPLISNESLVHQLVEENYRLKLDLRATRRKNGVYLDQDHYKQMIQSLSSLKSELSEVKAAKLLSENKLVQLSEQLRQEILLKERYKSSLGSSEAKMVDFENRLSIQQKSYVNLMSLADSVAQMVNTNMEVLDKEQDKLWCFLKKYIDETFRPLNERMQCVIDKNDEASVIGVNQRVKQQLNNSMVAINDIQSTLDRSLSNYSQLQKEISSKTKERIKELRNTELDSDSAFKQVIENCSESKSLVEESKTLNSNLYQQINQKIFPSDKEVLIRELMIFNASKLKEYQKEINGKITEMFKDLTSQNASNMASIVQARVDRSLNKWLQKSTDCHGSMEMITSQLFDKITSLDQMKKCCFKSYKSSLDDNSLLSAPETLQETVNSIQNLSMCGESLKDGHTKLYNSNLKAVDRIAECSGAMGSLSSDFSSVFEQKRSEFVNKKRSMVTGISSMLSQFPKGTKRTLDELNLPDNDRAGEHQNKKLAFKKDVLTKNETDEEQSTLRKRNPLRDPINFRNV